MDINLNEVTLESPTLEDDKYIFKIKHKGNNIILDNKRVYYSKLNEQDEIVQGELGITSKQDLKFLHDIQKKLYELFYDKHEEWFENKFTKQQFKSLFENYLHPNIEENCVNITLRNIDNRECEYTIKEIIPKILIDSIVYENESLYINVIIQDFSVKPSKVEVKEDVQNANIRPTDSEIHSESLTSDDQNEENIEKNVSFSNNNETNDLKKDSEISEQKDDEYEELSIQDELEEVVFDHSNMDKTSLNLNDEDLYIIYKIINSNIKENLSDSIIRIMKEKNVRDTEKINISEIIYDSDEEDSDEEDDYLNNDDFEDDYKNLM